MQKDMSSNSSSSQGSFLNGFTVGIFAGAVGFFLFGTDKGGKVRQTVVKEWDQAKVHLAKEGVIPSAEVSIRDIFKQVVDMFATEDAGKKVNKVVGKTLKEVKEVIKTKTADTKPASKPGASSTKSKTAATQEVTKKRTFKNV